MTPLLLLLLIMILGTDVLIRRLARYQRPWYLSPVVWMEVPWIFSCILIILPIFVHREIITLEHVLFIFLCHLGFALGCWAQAIKSPNENNPTESSISYMQMIIFAAIGVLGHMAGTYDSISSTGVSLAERFSAEGLARARAGTFMEQTGLAEPGPFNKIATVAAFSYLYIACYVLVAKNFVGKQKNMLRWLLWVSVACIAFNSLLVSIGRMHIILLGAVTLVIFLIKRSREAPKKASKYAWQKKAVWGFGGAVVLSTVAILGSIFGQARTGGLVSPDELLAISHRIKLEPEIDSLTRGNNAMRFGLFTLSYFTVPIPTLAFYLDVPSNRYPGPFFGQYNFPSIMGRVVKRVSEDNYQPWMDLRMDVFSELERSGYATNVWATMLRDISVDVTKPGTPFAMFGIGLLVSYIVTAARKSLNPFITTTASALLVVCGFSIFHSLLYIESISGLITIPMLTLAIMKIPVAFKFRGK